MAKLNRAHKWKIPANEKKRKESRAEAADRIRDVIRANWMLSDREIARLADTTHKTVAKYRAELVDDCEAGEAPKVSTQQSQGKEVDTFAISPAPENFDLLYEPIRDDDPEFKKLVADIRENGILDALVVSADGFILSGHRRHAAAKKLRLKTVPVTVSADVRYADDRDRFVRLLASHNTQRVKTTSMMMRDGIVGMSGEACQVVSRFRRQKSRINGVEVVELRGEKKRSKIRDKMGLFDAVKTIVVDHKADWPLSVRKIFYLLLNVVGLLVNDRRKTPFLNSAKCYSVVTDVCARMRLDGSIPFDCIADETRPVVIWDTHRSVQTFVDKELAGLFSGYFRDLLQSQSNHIELLVEKNTVASSLRRLAWQYRIPMTSGRGYSSLSPRKEMADRFAASGREKLVVIVVSDCDPEGFDIPAAFGRSLRDDFYIDDSELAVIRAALTFEQAQSLDLHQGQLAKTDSTRFAEYQRQFGDRCWELEAVPTDTLRAMVEETIQSVLDLKAFETEVERENEEQEELDEHRERIRELLREFR